MSLKIMEYFLSEIGGLLMKPQMRELQKPQLLLPAPIAYTDPPDPVDRAGMPSVRACASSLSTNFSGSERIGAPSVILSASHDRKVPTAPLIPGGMELKSRLYLSTRLVQRCHFPQSSTTWRGV